MSNIVVVELQAVAGGLQLVKRTLDDILARVTADPGPVQDPNVRTTIAAIVATSQVINSEAIQIQTIANPTGGGGVVGAGGGS